MEIHRKRIDHPAAWRRDDFAGKEDVCVDFGPAELAAIDEAIAAVRARSLALEDIERRDFGQPSLAKFMDEVVNEVMHGHGLVILRGFPADRHDEENIGKIFWGIGRHFGLPVSQSVMGERLGHVINVTDVDPHARAYRNKDELYPHTDIEDVVSFLCLHPAKSGGVSRFVSALAVHNELLVTRPELLEPLYRGFYYHRFGEHAPGTPPITRHRVPLFSCRDGLVSCRYVRQFIEIAAQESDRPLSALERAALDGFDEISRRPEMGIDVTLERGEAVFMNNFTVLHARTRFEDHDDPALKRHLMRLWLLADSPRPVVPEVAVHEGEFTGVGIAPQEGRTPTYAHKVTRH